ncbi:MAG: Arsenical resistance operon repressor [Syntrophaceae bacterium PtaU1.Bin231]|nr:MAG: Arsenical resistance operon repressor [Syntrophaceae bacterium PtaU1.Bin231]
MTREIAMQEFIAVMKALREPNRVKIVKLLQRGELCVCEIQAALGISQGCVSKHLEILCRAGLVDRRKSGPWAHFRLAGEPRSACTASLLGNLRHWLEADPEIAETIAKLPDIRRRNLCRKARSTGPHD